MIQTDQCGGVLGLLTLPIKTVRETLPDYGEGLRVVGGFGCSRGLDVGDLGGGRESRLVIV